jgi:hypothetical protein
MRGHEKTLEAKAQAGFTLIEVTFAGFVLAVTVLGLTATLTTGHKLTQSSREEVTARYAMRNMLAQLSDANFETVSEAFNAKGFAVEGLHPAETDKDGLPGEVIFEAGPEDAPSMHKVTLRVCWQGHTGERSIENVHYIANVRGAPGQAQSAAANESIEAAATEAAILAEEAAWEQSVKGQ